MLKTTLLCLLLLVPVTFFMEPVPALAAITESRISLPTQNVVTGTTDSTMPLASPT